LFLFLVVLFLYVDKEHFDFFGDIDFSVLNIYILVFIMLVHFYQIELQQQTEPLHQISLYLFYFLIIFFLFLYIHYQSVSLLFMVLIYELISDNIGIIDTVDTTFSSRYASAESI